MANEESDDRLACIWIVGDYRERERGSRSR